MAYIKSNITLQNNGLQSNWNQLDNTKEDFIKNKPVLKVNQIILGIINGINNIFNVSESFNIDTEQLFNNGVLLKKPDDYNISETTITLTFSPQIGEVLTINYIKQ